MTRSNAWTTHAQSKRPAALKGRTLTTIVEETEGQLFRHVAIPELLEKLKSDRLLGRLKSGQDLNLRMEGNSAALIREANELNAKAATAQAVSVSTGLQSGVYQNLQGGFRKTNLFPGITVDPNGSTYTVSDEAGFIAAIRQKYQSGPDKQHVHPYVEKKLRDIARSRKLISTFAGIPALHAEVRAFNDILWQISPDQMPTPQQLADVQVSTYKLGKASFGCQQNDLTHLESANGAPQTWVLFNPFTKLEHASKTPKSKTEGMKFAEWMKAAPPGDVRPLTPGARRPGTPGGQFAACTNCQMFLEIPQLVTGKLLTDAS